VKEQRKGEGKRRRERGLKSAKALIILIYEGHRVKGIGEVIAEQN